MTIRAQHLQLLVVLHALLEEQSVTRAALRLNLTQPAVSQALARARKLFEDPLFQRVGTRMVPTPRARALAEEIGGWMEATRAILDPAGFDPASEQREFLISSNDFAELHLLPPVVAAVRREAPNVTISLRSVESSPLSGRDVREGRVDLVVAGIEPPAGFVERALYDEHFVLLARHGHPALRRPLSPAAFAAIPQALVSPQGIGNRGPIDNVLAGLGLARTIALSVTRFTSLAALVARTDLIAAVPSRFAQRPEIRAICASTDLPFPPPRFTMRLAWHQHFESDAGHRWLRELAHREIMAQIDGEQRPSPRPA
jgi:DNA-binding transcriptional LysR family regulator